MRRLAEADERLRAALEDLSRAQFARATRETTFHEF
jgi:hypothetical protein